MNDREKVINDLQDAVNDDWMWRHADYYALTMERALDLLKEQEQTINELEEKLRLLEYGDQDILQSGMMPAT